MKVHRFRQSMLAVAGVAALTVVGCATPPQVPQNVQCTPETVAAFRAKTQAIQANAATDTGSYNAGLIPIVGGFFAVGNYSEKRSQAAQIMAEAQALDAACKAAGGVVGLDQALQPIPSVPSPQTVVEGYKCEGPAIVAYGRQVQCPCNHGQMCTESVRH